MDQQEIRAMQASEYMGPAQLAFFEKLLRKLDDEAMQSIADARQSLAGLGVAADTIDQASIEEDRQSIARALERLKGQLYAIRRALNAICDGEFGWCEDTGEAIGLDRLLAQPTARLSAAAQTLHEKMSKHYAAA